MINNFLLVGGNFILDAFAHLTFLLDKGVYTLVQLAYSVFYYLANATILNSTIVENFTYRMYTLLGIIMVFVLAFNLLTYIVDPDKITDKKAGAASFVKDVILAIVIISISPMLFTKLYSLQAKILNSGIIENLILGGATSEAATSADDYYNNQGSDQSLTEYYVHHGGDTMVASIYTAFLYPAGGEFTALDCKPTTTDGTTQNGQYEDYCIAYKDAKDGKGISAFSDFIANDDYNFTPFLTTVAGIVLLFFMLSFCINLAKRVGKMAIIQLIAPIPVTLELLPNKKGLRENWLKTLGKVYIEVFFYMMVMFFIILLISMVPGTIETIFDGLVGGGIGPVKLFATAILIYGLLMFGKEAPQMLFDLLGLKSTGMIKEAALRGVKMAGSVTAGLGAGATTLTRGGVGMIKNVAGASGTGEKAKALAGGLIGMGTGTFTAAARGMYANRSGGFKGIVGRTSTAINQNAEAQRRTAATLKKMPGNIKKGAHDYATNISGATGFINKAGAVFKPLTESGVGKWANLSHYQNQKNTEAVHREYKKLYSDGIESIWKNDSKWQAYNAELMRAQAAGDTVAATNAKNKLDARKAEALKENKLKFMEAAGRLNNFIEVHQGVDGITTGQINLEDIRSIATDADATARLTAVENLVKDDGMGGGFKPTLDRLANDADYQRARVEEKLKADAKEASRKAAEEKNKK